VTNNAAAKCLGVEVARSNFGKLSTGKQIGRLGRPRGEAGAGIDLVEGVVAEMHELPFDLCAARRAIRGGEDINRLEPATAACHRFGGGKGLRDGTSCPALPK